MQQYPQKIERKELIMNQTVQTKKQAKSTRWQDFKVMDEDTDTIFQLAFKNKWKDVEVFGHGRMIDETMEVNGWILKPINSCTDSIPQEGLDILKIIESSVELAGVVIADDKRKAKPDLYKNDRVILDLNDVGKILGVIGIATLVLIAAPLILFALGTMLMMIVLPLLLAGLLAYDPAIICVTREGTWIKVFEW